MSLQSNYNICISQNNTSTQFFSDILEPLNYHYLDGTEKNPKYSKFHIFQKDPSLTKGFRQWSYPVSDARAVLEAHKGLVDCYVSTNESTFKRREADVNALTMLTCDLDTYKSEKYHSTSHERLITDVKGVCVSFGLPYPSIIYSGNGYYLKWIFISKVKVNPNSYVSKVDKKKRDFQIVTPIDIWKSAQIAINRIFTDFGSDTNALDASRVLRMCGTINSKTGKMAELLEFNGKVSYEEMLEILKPHTTSDDINSLSPLPKVKPEKAPKKPALEIVKFESVGKIQKNTPHKNFIPKNRLSLAIERYKDLLKLIELRGGVVQEGQRMSFLLWILNFKCIAGAIHIGNFDEEALKMGNKIFNCDDFSLDDLSTLRNKLEEYNLRRVKNSQDFNKFETIPLYTPTSQTLIAKLNITKDEQTHLKTIIDKDEVKERAKNRKYNERRAKGMKEQNGDKEKTPWKDLGVGRTKYYEMKKNGLI
ncbi:hypothetical protein [Pseudomonas helleri]|uniref:hypothetical protein n=1 Tax=Pseudomonas helleri TaxID=1608996 RepID=UPI003FCFD23C